MTMPTSLTFSGWNWLWPVVAFGVVAVLVLIWSYRAAAGHPAVLCFSPGMGLSVHDTVSGSGVL